MIRLDLDAAVALARSRIDQIAKAAGDQYEMLLDQTKILERGWIFFFNTEEYVRTRNPSTALAGNGTSAIPWEAAIQQI